MLAAAVDPVPGVDLPIPAAWLPMFVVLDQYGEPVRVFMFAACDKAGGGVRFLGVGDLGPVWVGASPVIHAHRVAAGLSTGAGPVRVERWHPGGGRETVAGYEHGQRTRY